MSDSTEAITLTPEEEASRLWAGACAAFEQAEGSFVSLCEALDLGARAIEIAAVERLQPALARFPATIGAQLEKPGPDLDLQRDAVHLPRTLSFTDVLDLLSEESAECVSPHLHRGWEDRRFSCRRSRDLARETTGAKISAEDHPRLLLLAAYRNRIFRVPPPVRVVRGDIVAAFPALERLYVQLS